MEQKDQAQTTRGMSTPAYIASVLFVVVALTAGAVFIGRSDSGQIDVSATIKNASSEQTDADGNVTEREENYTPPALRNKPNGGLVPQDPSGLPPTPPPESETETEDTTSDTAEDGDETDGDTPATSDEGGAEELLEGETETEAGVE